MTDHVFGYGSLVAPGGHPGGGFVAELAGMARGWGVAMDNTADRSGYKCYLDRAGRRPRVFVCFLDIVDSPGDSVNGLCLPVSPEALSILDARERNYDRIEVSDRIGVGLGVGAGRVWAYRGSAAGRRRFREGAASGTAVIHAGYLEAVRVAFQGLGTAEWERCAPSLAPGVLPVLELARREL